MNDHRSHLPPLFQQNEVLFGHAGTPGVIACEIQGSDQVTIFSRQDGESRSENVPFQPFLLTEGDEWLQGWRGEAKIEPLGGPGSFNRLALFADLKQWESAKTYLQTRSGKSSSAGDAPYWCLSDPLHQFLLLSGKTHFLGMTFHDLKRMQIHIETYCQDGFEFPAASRPSDRIIAIGLSDGDGWERLISGKECEEAEMLGELVKEIQQRDPDVIEGHNLFRSGLEYIEARARRLKVELALGRDRSCMRGQSARMQIAERTINYRKYAIFGRHIIDTWILAQHYDIATRELESFELHDIAHHLGVARNHPARFPAEKASWYFDHDPTTLFGCALDSVRETGAVAEVLSPSHFVQAQIFPYSYQNVPLRGNATKIDALFVREYLDRRRAIPRPDQGREVVGGFTHMEFQGTAQHVLHCDVTSLYPSIMLTYDYLPKKDDLGVATGLLRDLRAFRVKAKELARAAREPETRVYFNALQSTFKILVNSFYGYLGFEMGHFNDFAAANQVTAKGRELVQSAIAWLKQEGAKIIEVDTDGIYFVPPDTVTAEADEQRLIERLGRILPDGIELELDGRYPAMFSYKMKNYALLDEQERLLIKGSGLRSRGLELIQREWMEEMLMLLLKDERDKIPILYERYLDDLEQHRHGVSWFMKTETLQDSLSGYQAKVKAGKRNAAAPYELALKANRSYQPGDQIAYYVTGAKAKVKISANCKLASQWDAQQPDENVEHYKAKLKELYDKFKPWIETANPQLELPS
jgi:DNA polymerase elongation subunit (family B)